ncbi:hypothetical protein NECID01_0213 [Nematocida sp. AWRm77]|nr:hypothetical protein NECID01_0213 [Nematocida sp. AWRm77]
MSAGRVVHVDLAQKEVELQSTSKQKKRKTADTYDTNDPFFQEDEAVGPEHAECQYENFYCVSGEKMLSIVEKKREEKKEEHKIKKEKRESTRQKFLEEKEELLASIKAGDVSETDFGESAQKLVVLEILTAQDAKPETLLQAAEESLAKDQFEKISPLIKQSFTKESVEHILEKAVGESQALQEEIKEEIEKEKQKVEELEAEDPTDAKYAKLQFDAAFIEKLCQYTDKEYLVIYFNMYLSGKKRVLEYGIKKNIFCQLQSFFPSTYGSNGSLGKKIASHVLKKRNRKHTESDKSGVAEAEAEADPSDIYEREAASSTETASQTQTQTLHTQASASSGMPDLFLETQTPLDEEESALPGEHSSLSQPDSARDLHLPPGARTASTTTTLSSTSTSNTEEEEEDAYLNEHTLEEALEHTPLDDTKN